MRIEITNSCIDSGDKLLKEYPLLSEYNPEIVVCELDSSFNKLFIEINTLDDLRQFSVKLEQDVIYSRQKNWTDEYLVIYD